MKETIEETQNAQMEALEFRQKERDAKYFPFANQVEYMRALLAYTHPMHKEAMALNAKRAVGKQKVQHIDHKIETNLADEFERYARS